jgi:hypothetical protein
MVLQWLNENAGAVQGVSAAVTVALTALLAYVTWRYVRLTDRLLRNAQDQFHLGQRQFELLRKQAVLPYLPQFMFNVEQDGTDSRNWKYKFGNGCSIPLLVRYAEIQFRCDSKTFSHRLHGLSGRVLPVMRANDFPQAGKFVIPDEYWIDGLSALAGAIGERITTEVVVSDIGKLFTYRCRFNALTGYVVEQI